MSGIILDTDIISGVMREGPDDPITIWMSRHLPALFYLTSITIAELWQGVGKLDSHHSKRAYYIAEIETIDKRFENRILDFDKKAARLWGEMRGEALRKGRIIPELDLQIAVRLAPRHVCCDRQHKAFYRPWPRFD